MSKHSEEMRDSYLVQRLTKPRGTVGPLKDNPFSFGGGLRNGGLSDDAMGLLRDVFGFDYMGSSEFEWGAVPEALQRIAKAKDLTAFTVPVPLQIVPPHWQAPKDEPPPEGSATVFVLCRDSQATEVTSRVMNFAARKGRTKDRVGLDSALRPHNEWDGDTQGWLELDNGYFFFTSEQMWSETCALFGVKAQVSA